MHRTLVVDDSPTIRRMVTTSLRHVCTGGFQEAATGLEALEQLAVGPIELMILDLNMPDVQAFRHIPIVILTTRGDEASRAAVMAAGASLYLTKPFTPQLLAEHVRELLARTLPPAHAVPVQESHDV